MAKDKNVWACTECGVIEPKWVGCCRGCKSWNTFVEEIQVEKRFLRSAKGGLETAIAKPIPIAQVPLGKVERLITGIEEFDRLLGGGVVKGSLTLIGGSPGIGKSTLLLQISSALALKGERVLYVCGEESQEQTSMRGRRLGIVSDHLYLLSETVFSSIHKAIDELKPTVVIVDSIQIVYKSDFPSAPGSVLQVREVTCELMHLAKGNNITIFVIGHVTKSGELAGPRVLEHLVDTVLEFEGDRQQGFRLLRSMKNRFGPTEEIAIFQMKPIGLVEVENPSKIFLEERVINLTGSVLVAAVEGMRSFLLEVQSLVSGTHFSAPSRRSAGFDPNRLALLIAVLEKRVGYKLQNCDIFVSIAGGVKIVEPALDLAVVLAIASSFSTRIIDPNTVVMGEVGLGGEIRAVNRIESRIREASQMGCKRCILPQRNLQGLSSDWSHKMQLVGVTLVEEALEQIF